MRSKVKIKRVRGGNRGQRCRVIELEILSDPGPGSPVFTEGYLGWMELQPLSCRETMQLGLKAALEMALPTLSVYYKEQLGAAVGVMIRKHGVKTLRDLLYARVHRGLMEYDGIGWSRAQMLCDLLQHFGL